VLLLAIQNAETQSLLLLKLATMEMQQEATDVAELALLKTIGIALELVLPFALLFQMMDMRSEQKFVMTAQTTG